MQDQYMIERERALEFFNQGTNSLKSLEKQNKELFRSLSETTEENRLLQKELKTLHRYINKLQIEKAMLEDKLDIQASKFKEKLRVSIKADISLVNKTSEVLIDKETKSSHE